MENYKCSSVGIVGAGIQGVCIGLQLVKKGIPVTIFDKFDPRDNTSTPASYGNAGHFSPYAVLKFNRPDILYNIPKMLFSSNGPLALKWNHVPKMIPWFINYLRNCNKKSMLHTAKYMHQICNLSLDAYEEIFQEIDTTNLIEKKGIIYVWKNSNIKSRELEIKVRNDLGIQQKLLSRDEIIDLEPNLNPIFDAGVLFENSMHARDPFGILKKIFDLYLKKGGKFIKEKVENIKQIQENKTVIKSINREYKFEKSVIASGAFSKKLTDQLEENIPLDTERGYHVHYKDYAHLISRPVICLDNGFSMSPMNQGLRAVGTVELGGLTNPPTKKRINYLIRCAKNLLPKLENCKHTDEWLGFRPSLPDFLPILGPSLKNKNIVYAFGHDHLGWTLGAITGKIVSGIVAEEKTNLDLSPYSSSRFN
jgi:D-amino-acid dehydrogenase